MSISNLIIKQNIKQLLLSTRSTVVARRHGHLLRGKPPGVARTLQQRLEEENRKDPELTARVNIGYPKLRPSRAEQVKERLQLLKQQRADDTIRKQARSKTLLIDLDQVDRDSQQAAGQFHLQNIADHYGIFEDLFGCAYFVPRVPLDIKYEVSSDIFRPVYNGNLVKTEELIKQPIIAFDARTDPISGEKTSNDTYWTLIATNPDGMLNDQECLHWFVGNIPNGELQKGEVIVDYMQPFPAKGLGYQRFVFLLYKQHAKLDFGVYKLPASDSFDLQKRAFKTLEFYRQHQDNITPAGLAFCQTSWDKSVSKFYHEILKTKEPIYEYDFPRPYLSEQEYFPLRQPFNLYMDKHRDIKEVNKEYLERLLDQTHPFNGPPPPLRFPNAHAVRDVPSWLRTEIKKDRLGVGRINDYGVKSFMRKY